MKTYGLISLGCKVNRSESDDYETLLESLGYRKTDLEKADLIIINTCTVTATADKKARKATRNALALNTHAPLWVTGCAAAVNGDQFSSLSARVTVVSRESMLQMLQDLASRETPNAQTSHLASTPNRRPAVLRRSRPNVKIQDGCDGQCSYCIVPKARGKAASRPVEAVRAEVSNLALAGAQEIVLSGIDLGSYHSDDGDLAGLLRKLLLDLNPPIRLRLSSVEPINITDELIDLMATSQGRLCRHLHLPLQSGSDSVLQRMNRPYDSAYFIELCDRIRKALPSVVLSSDIIVGFPGETEEDFEKSVSVIKRSGLSRLHVFVYSPRPSTPAATFADPVPKSIAEARAACLRQLSDELIQQDLESRYGETQWAVREHDNFWRLESYQLVESPWDTLECPVGALAPFPIEPPLKAL